MAAIAYPELRLRVRPPSRSITRHDPLQSRRSRAAAATTASPGSLAGRDVRAVSSDAAGPPASRGWGDLYPIIESAVPAALYARAPGGASSP